MRLERIFTPQSEDFNPFENLWDVPINAPARVCLSWSVQHLGKNEKLYYVMLVSSFLSTYFSSCFFFLLFSDFVFFSVFLLLGFILYFPVPKCSDYGATMFSTWFWNLFIVVNPNLDNPACIGLLMLLYTLKIDFIYWAFHSRNHSINSVSMDFLQSQKRLF